VGEGLGGVRVVVHDQDGQYDRAGGAAGGRRPLDVGQKGPVV
jgi:hypothetical protein